MFFNDVFSFHYHGKLVVAPEIKVGIYQIQINMKKMADNTFSIFSVDTEHNLTIPKVLCGRHS